MESIAACQCQHTDINTLQFQCSSPGNCDTSRKISESISTGMRRVEQGCQCSLGGFRRRRDAPAIDLTAIDLKTVGSSALWLGLFMVDWAKASSSALGRRQESEKVQQQLAQHWLSQYAYICGQSAEKAHGLSDKHV